MINVKVYFETQYRGLIGIINLLLANLHEILYYFSINNTEHFYFKCFMYSIQLYLMKRPTLLHKTKTE